tara:strand:+ start:60 stop:566 length:507 start_codon:yes stop_codon:yes gene_type:complete
MEHHYNIDPERRKKDLILLFLFFPLFGTIIYFIDNFLIGSFSILMMKILLVPVGIYALLQIIQNLSKKPSVTANELGIKINRPHSIKLIKWEEIKNIRTQSIRNTNFICIDLFNSVNQKEKFSFLSKFLLQSNDKVFKTPFVIKDKIIGNKLNEFLHVVNEKRNTTHR